MPIEQVFKNYEKAGLKMAMLKHEETFRQQVHELHRLYRIQKLLMRDLKRELKSQRSVSSCADYNRGALELRFYQQCYTAARGAGHAAAPRTALRLDAVAAPGAEYVQSPEEDAEETDDDEEAEAELELTLAVGAAAKKRYSSSEHSPGQSFSSSSTESDVLTGSGREEWQAHGAAGSPYHKRRPAGFDVAQVEDGGVQPPAPLLFHWLSLRMA